MKFESKRYMAFFLIIVIALSVNFAYASSCVYGNSGSTKTFYVHVTQSDAYIKLESFRGYDEVEPWSIWGYALDHEIQHHHGFYQVKITDPYGNKSTVDWCPSATRNLFFQLNGTAQVRGTTDDDVIKLTFANTGTYTITVVPYSAQEITNSYWQRDHFICWTEYATWEVAKESGCSCDYSAQQGLDWGEFTEAVVSGTNEVANQVQRTQEVQLRVRCLDENGLERRVYLLTVGTYDQYVYPEDIAGYEKGEPVYIWFDAYGNCNTNEIIFYYRKKPESTPTSNGGKGAVVYPNSWDTQFKPGTSAENKYNDKRYLKLDNLHDDNYQTSFNWLIWTSEMKDDIPEITAHFSGETVSSIGIRNGYLKSESEYWQYARATRLNLTICDYSGNVYNTSICVPDYYTTNYQVFSLGGTYTNVATIKIWLADYNNNESADINHKNVVQISDIQFYN